MEQLNRAKSPYRVNIPDDLIPKLRALRASQRDWHPCREVIEAEDVLNCHTAWDRLGFLPSMGVSWLTITTGTAPGRMKLAIQRRRG